MAGSTGGDESPTTLECCMCGDHGLSDELFRCKSCHFRSQHRYCSNLYPKADSYGYCNWCLKEDEVRAAIPSPSNSNGSRGGVVVADVKLLRGEFPLSLSNPIKKQRSPERSKLSAAAAVQRTRSDDVSSIVKSKQVFRGKVRRYKLLEEVSS
ncbi:hypothetical protein H6P81_010742 [Aristolochia fimbriata]|uniref:PHD-type zinc finger plants domain-containing protein n=1 Tax=Aristolochia fimbriata TaxID=158543 RepID=A0AAV7ET08_ARIFI|nr:hypothetical protein H6P81_010742 [Aristolochia fimbriata]